LFTGLEAEGVVQIVQPESTGPEARRQERLAAENAAFSSEHYMADLVEDDLVKEAISFVPWWSAPGAQSWREDAAPASSVAAAGDTSASAGPAGDGTGREADPVPAMGTSAALPSPFGIGSDYQTALLQLPRTEFLLTSDGRRHALCGLVDLLFAYAYDVRTTQGEPTVESGWTLCRLSSLLSCLETFDSVMEAAVAAVRRSLCYPLVRHLELSRAALADVSVLVRLGRPAVLRALLDVRRTVQQGGEYGYLLNRVWTDDYCVWVQQLPPHGLLSLAEQLEGVTVSADMLSWPLATYEELAWESLAEPEAVEEEEDDDDDDDDDDSDDSDDSGDSDDSDDSDDKGFRQAPCHAQAAPAGILV
jgi:protein SHQ1